MNLTVEQTDLLFDVTEHHLKWYLRYYPDPPEFNTLLELNHLKLRHSFPDGMKYTEEDVTNKLLEYKQQYIDMLIDTSDNIKVEKPKKKKGKGKK